MGTVHYPCQGEGKEINPREAVALPVFSSNMMNERFGLHACWST